MKKSILYNQNFIRDPHLVTEIVRQAAFGPADMVYEIGPGTGIITRELVQTAGKVKAVEIDPRLAAKLRFNFSGCDRVKIINADWLKFWPKEFGYKVFANIPFNLTAEIVNRLVSGRKLAEAYLVVQKEAAEKFCGWPRSTQWSVLHLPWFEVKIVWYFRRSDFFPQPKVMPVLLKIKRRPIALIEAKDKGDYYDLALASFNNWRRLRRELKLPQITRPGNLSFDRWLELFKFYRMVK